MFYAFVIRIARNGLEGEIGKVIQRQQQQKNQCFVDTTATTAALTATVQWLAANHYNKFTHLHLN